MKHITTLACLLLLCLTVNGKGFRDHLEGLVYEAEDWSEPKASILKDDFGDGHWCLWTTEEDVWNKRSQGQSIKTPTVRADRKTPEEGAPVLHTKITGIPNGFYQVFMNNTNRLMALSQDGGKTWYSSNPGGEEMLGFHDITNGTFELWLDDRYTTPANIGSAYYDYIRFVPAEMPTLYDVSVFTLPDKQTQLSWISSSTLPAATVRFREAGGAWQEILETEKNMRNHAVILPNLNAGATYEAQIICPLNKIRNIESKLVSFVAGAMPKPSATIPQTIELKVFEPSKTARRNWPVHNGVPFARGALADAADVVLTNAQGQIVPKTVYKVMTRWDDGSVQWLAIDFFADTIPGKDVVYLLKCAPDTRKPSSKINSQDFTAKEVADLIEGISAEITFANDNSVYKSDIQKAQDITQEGSDHLIIHGDFVNERNVHKFSWRLEADFRHNDSETHSLKFTVCNNDFSHHSAMVKSLCFKNATGQHYQRFLSDGTQLPDKFSVRQFTDSEAQITRGNQTSTVKHFDGALIFQDTSAISRTICGGMKNFWQTYPKGVDITPDGMTWWLLPELPQTNYPPKGWNDLLEECMHWYWYKKGYYQFRQGMEISHEFCWYITPQPKSTVDPSWLQYPLFARATPDYYCSTKAFGNIIPASDKLFPEYEAAFAKSFENQQLSRESKQKEYGWMNYGDWYGERAYNWGNNEYDMGYTLALHFARTGKLDLLWRGADMEKHYSTVDICHASSKDSKLREAIYGHCIGHVGMFIDRNDERIKPLKVFHGFPGGMHDTGHTHLPGLYYYACLTADESMLETAKLCGWNQAKNYTPNFSFAIERAAGWPLINATYSYKFTNNPYYLNAAKIYFEKIKSIQNPQTGCFDLRQDQSECDCPDKAEHRGGKAFATGVLLHGLARLWEQTHNDDVKTCIIRCADWLLDISWNEAVQGFRYKTGCPKYANSGWYAVIVTDGIAYATELTGNRRYIDFLERTVGRTLAKSTGWGPSSGKDFAQFNRHIPHLLYYLHKYGIDSTPIYVNPINKNQSMMVDQNHHGTFAPIVTNSIAAAVPCTLTVTSNNGSVRFDKTQVSWQAAGGSHAAPAIGVDMTAEQGDFTYTIAFGKRTYTGTVAVYRQPPLPVLGSKIGAIGSTDHFTLDALKRHGLTCETGINPNSRSLDGYKAIIIAADAFSLGSASTRPKPLTALGIARLAAFAQAGGTVVCFQLNDSDWPFGWFGDALVIEEPDSTATTIIDRSHWLFAGVDSILNQKCYDRVAFCGPAWKKLAMDSAGRPCILSLAQGKGEILVIIPNFDRLYSEPNAIAIPQAACQKLLTNIINRVTK